MLMSEVVCLYYPVAGLVNTMDKYGIQVMPGYDINVLASLTNIEKQQLRENGRKYAESCSCENRAQMWNKILFQPNNVNNINNVNNVNNINNINNVNNVNETPIFFLSDKNKNTIYNLYNNLKIPDNHISYLKKLKNEFGFIPKVIYDIGSNVLHWSREAKTIWPESNFILFDGAQNVEFLYKEKGYDKYHIGVLSDKDNREVKFYENYEMPGGNSYYREIGHPLSKTLFSETNCNIQITKTLKTVVNENKYPLPDLVKIDVQGSEIDILNGGQDIIKYAEYLIVELQSVEYNEGAILAPDSIKILEKLGWELVECFCSNGPDADYCFKNTNVEKNRLMLTKSNSINHKTKNIAIFNSFPFHYEMFGYIINYCYQKKFTLTIYTNNVKDIGWFDFYNSHFKDYNIKYKSINDFNNERDTYDFIFITTDDEPLFNSDWITDKCICIRHSSEIRNAKFMNNLGTRPFVQNYINWALPCYPILSIKDKINNNFDQLNIALIGGHYYYKYDIVNRISSSIQNINFHIIGRYANFFKSEFVTGNKNIIIYQNLETNKINELLARCDYILSDTGQNLHHSIGITMSGCVPIAFSTLTPLIISKINNKLYNFKNVIEFDIETNEPIILEKNIINIESLYNERQLLVNMFSTYVNNFINNIENGNNKNTALIIEPRDLNNIEFVINDTKQKLGDNWIIVFYCGKGLKDKWSTIFNNSESIEIRELDTNNFTSLEYSDFMKSKELWSSLYGEYVLTFQLDTFIVNEKPYDIDYFINMNKSYIGGNMNYLWFELVKQNIYNIHINQDNHCNFNGGLSLRKINDMIKIIDVFGVQETRKEISNNMLQYAEDVYFTVGCYKLGLPVGDNEESQHFALHTIWKENYFGLHNPSEIIINNLDTIKKHFSKETRMFYQ